MLYLLDTNIFIQAKNLHYGMDFCPAFWDWLIDQNARGHVHSIEKVADELALGSDELSTWADARGEPFFLPPDESTLEALPKQSYRSIRRASGVCMVALIKEIVIDLLLARVPAHRTIHHDYAYSTPSNSRVPTASTIRIAEVTSLRAVWFVQRT
jgi:Domain of unknown function (DUF4411)